MFHAGLLLLGAVKSTLVWSQLFIQFQLFFFQRLVYSVHVAYSIVNILHVITCHALLICPIAIAYSMAQIIKSVCVCQCVSVSVHLRALSRSHFLIDFHQDWHRRKNPQKEERVRYGSISHHSFPYFAPPPLKKNFNFRSKVLKTHANIK